jgi:hypothetical protein
MQFCFVVSTGRQRGGHAAFDLVGTEGFLDDAHQTRIATASEDCSTFKEDERAGVFFRDQSIAPFLK